MSQRVVGIVCTVTFTAILAFYPTLNAADDKDTKPATSTSSDKPPDFSKYAFVGDAVGEIVKADDNSLTVRMTWLAQVNQPNKGRPQLQGGKYHHPHAPVPKGVKEEHHDYTIQFVPETQIRTKVLPPKTDDKGKKVDYTAKELETLKGKWSFPGYAASASDLVPGTIVEVHLMRDKSILASKATDDDMRVKYAVVLGKDQNPPKDITTPPKTKN